MTASSNLPPEIKSVAQVHNTVSTDPQTVSAEISDCDPENNLRAGVKSAFLRYTVSPGPGLPQGPRTTLALTSLGDTWIKEIPGQAPGSTVEYRFVAFDSTGLADSTGTYSYRIINFSNDFYRCDTTLACTSADIRLTGTPVDTSRFFEVPNASANANKGDDGTAGPFDLGGPFVFYGDTMRYAWVGVDGAIALSKTATDTIDVNANGFATDGFDFPQRQHHSRADTNNAGRIPKAFIAPYWADWILTDTFHTVFGKTLTQNTGGKIICQWGGVGAFIDIGAQSDDDTFRVILNRTNNSIEFQYDNIGVAGLDTANLTGIQCDSNYHPVTAGLYPPFNYFNKDRYPEESRLHSGLCIHYTPVVYHRAALSGWNLVSNGCVTTSNDTSYLYPDAVSPNAFSYNGGYVPTQTIDNCGGYWLKLPAGQEIICSGLPLLSRDCPIQAGWNMIGSLSGSVPTSTITTTGSATKGSSFFGYGGSGYTTATSIDRKSV